MSAKPFAEAYEKAKELRRQGESILEIQMNVEHEFKISIQLGHKRRALGALAAFMRKLAGKLDRSANWLRTLGIKTLANRVFGDEKKAEAWLLRPNASLSGQRPVDLLKDELGAIVVREELERIDHGIFA